MQVSDARLFIFLTLLFVSLFSATVTASAIPKPDAADFEASVQGLLSNQKRCVQPPDCGSSPFQPPCNECNSASSLHLPFRSVFKLPALLINTLAFDTSKARTITASAILKPATADFEVSVRDLLSTGCVQPPDCGSSPFQTPCNECNSASSLHLPFRSVFKLPALLINTLAFGTGKVRSAVLSQDQSILRRDGPIPSTNLDRRDGVEERSPQVDAVGNHCGFMAGGFELFPCNAASNLKVPSVFRLPTLLSRCLVLISKSMASALPATADSIAKRCECNLAFLTCFPINAVYSLQHFVSTFTVPSIFFNIIALIPGTMAAATPRRNKIASGDAETLPPVELTSLSRSITPGIRTLNLCFHACREWSR